MHLSKDEILNRTQAGLYLFEFLLPDLQMSGSKNITNIDSPLSNGTKCLSVFYWDGKYRFKDHYWKISGDIFEFVARLNKLNSKHEFTKVLEVIEKIMADNFFLLSKKDREEYSDPVEENELVLLNKEISNSFVEKYFMKLMPYLENALKYEIHLVESFAFTEIDDKFHFYEFCPAKPYEAFYALTIKKGQFYILFNPKTGQFLQWGNAPEFYLVGQDHLFNIAYTENIYLRNSLVITNSIEGLLYLQDKGIPSVAILNKETILPEYFYNVILPKFDEKFILFDKIIKSTEDQYNSFVNGYNFKCIFYPGSYLSEFLKIKEDAADQILSNFHFAEDFEYIGVASNIVNRSLY